MRRPLVVVGLPTSLRSELAAAVAAKSGRKLVLCAAGSALEELWDSQSGVVVDLASDAWLDRDLRVRGMNRCVTVAAGGRAEGRKLAGAEENGCEARLWSAAAEAFAEVHKVVEVEKGGIERAAEEALRLWQLDPIGVAAGRRSYCVEVGAGIAWSRLAESVVGSATNLVISDSNVERLYGAQFQDALQASGCRIVKVVFEAGEQQKNLTTLSEIYAAAQRGGIDRASRVIGIGGGVVTDVAGFAAATWMRGLKWFGVSTTLLGMVDASVGGKTGVDFADGKNAVGAFWQPAGVVCDTELLATESERNFRGALAEVVKTAIVGDAELFELLESRGREVVQRNPELMAEVVRRCVSVKARVVGLDETEQGLRATLNLGHTVGHALEAGGGYGRWSHGEAVSLGLVAAVRLGERLGYTPGALADRIVRLQGKLGLPVDIEPGELESAAELLSRDKKKAGSSIRFVMVRGLGSVELQSVVLDDLREMVVGLGR